MSDDLDEPYRLEDYFCPGCLSARHDLCDGLNYWCTCLCIAEHYSCQGCACPCHPRGTR